MSDTKECIYKFDDGRCCRSIDVTQYYLKKENYIRYFLSCDEHSQKLKIKIESEGFSVMPFVKKIQDNVDEETKETIEEFDFCI